MQEMSSLLKRILYRHCEQNGSSLQFSPVIQKLRYSYLSSSTASPQPHFSTASPLRNQVSNRVQLEFFLSNVIQIFLSAVRNFR